MMRENVYNQIVKDLKSLARFESYEVSGIELAFYRAIQDHLTHQSAMIMPHESQYQTILDKVDASDIVLDAGAGFMTFPFMLSQKVKKVYAVEVNPDFVQKALGVMGYNLPRNLVVVCADWFDCPVPDDVTVITCLVNNPKIPYDWVKKEKDHVRIIHGEL